MSGISLHDTRFNNRFDVVEFIKKLRNAGVTQEVAEIQAQSIEFVLEQNRLDTIQALDNKELSTKGDLEVTKLELQKEMEVIRKEMEVIRKEIEVVRKEISEASTRTIIWVSGIFGAYGVFFFGVIAKGFHWI